MPSSRAPVRARFGQPFPRAVKSGSASQRSTTAVVLQGAANAIETSEPLKFAQFVRETQEIRNL